MTIKTNLTKKEAAKHVVELIEICYTTTSCHQVIGMAGDGRIAVDYDKNFCDVSVVYFDTESGMDSISSDDNLEDETVWTDEFRNEMTTLFQTEFHPKTDEIEYAKPTKAALAMEGLELQKAFVHRLLAQRIHVAIDNDVVISILDNEMVSKDVDNLDKPTAPGDEIWIFDDGSHIVRYGETYITNN